MADRNSFWPRVAVSTVAVCTLGWMSSGYAQTAKTQQAASSDSNTELLEITVTARKREESLRNVPVDEQAIPAIRLEQLQVTDLTDLPKLTPGLNMGHSVLSVGTLVSIRGIGTASQDPGVDQSIALNLDGLALGNGLAFSSGFFDIGGIEILKGPQALFFGKESPGGVISLRSADPTSEFEVVGSAAYEFESVQPRASFIISGPVTDTLKLRLATQYYHQEGYFHNDAIAEPGTGAMNPDPDRGPWGEDFIIRGTALWDPLDVFSARLKVNMAYDHSIEGESAQINGCPAGTAPAPGLPDFLGGGATCSLARSERVVFLDPADFPYTLNGGVPYVMTDQRYGTLELNYHPNSQINLSATTAYYHLNSSSMLNGSESTYAGPFIGVNNHYFRHDFSEELRANSDFHGPLNFTLGALYEDGKFSDKVAVLGNQAYGFLAPILVDGTTPVDITTKSVFGQVRWTIIDRLELDAGLRYSDERRSEQPYNNVTNEPTPVLVPSIHNTNYSPESTLTYRPTDDLTFYGAYKQGFKSGSFSVGTPPTPGEDNSFGPERVHGEEVGLKSLLLEHQLSLNVAPYYYRYSGLQVSGVAPPKNGVPVVQTLNAANAVVYGIDVDSALRPASIQGLQLNGDLEWNHGRYTQFNNAPCWSGQTIALGCNQAFDAGTGAYTAQNLSGTHLVRSPEWQMNLGFAYTMPVMNNYHLTVTNNYEYSGPYLSQLAIGYPGNSQYQVAYTKIDFGVILKDPSNVWELALIGKNINNKIISGNCEISNSKGGSIIPATQGTTSPGFFGYGDNNCFTDPGREIWLRVTYKPFGAHD